MVNRLARVIRENSQVMVNDCWYWCGSLDTKGYGRLSVARFGRKATVKAHRAAALLYGLVDVFKEGACVLHMCDVPRCVNPNHLFIGTKADNNRDRDRKGRTACIQGSAHYAAKLSEEQVIEIRSRYAAGGVRQHELAALYGVSRSNITQLLSGNRWKHVAGRKNAR